MSALLRNSGVLLLALGLAACQPPEPPVLAPAARATTQPAQQPAANDDLDPIARTPIVDPPPVEGTDGDDAPAVASVALDHAGEVLIGQHMSDLQALGPWTAQGAVEAMGGSCEYYDGKGLPPGVSMMTDEDRVVRFDLGRDPESGAPTPQPGPFGLRVGMTRAQAMAQFPKPPVSSPHAYDGDQGEYLTWQDPGSDLGIRVELFEGKVTRMYWGTSDAIELIEGCA
ncbi:hypothetical protein ROV86_13645 [Stenotrophomonas pavanii]|uniref:Lipoprotein n=1 Tax=Stenotrophomonas maltophilia TaxID=40324 RepID=A0AB34TFY7_STEMA|nr:MULTISPECIES: hypothetical protein [Stenotrophomonas]KOO81990.1 hypothetical protein VL23_01420 [Stenotrophomonas maltophilia]KRG82684.1 hypothetical protein ABB31_00590 [Stenotrophomonas pavanii]MBH1540365.1 hypothetical protein [Stenotrophomonas maltophilia]MBH1626242.1 hypothetical protein [Stenotrophomonas maltophilia]MBN4981758.1 hypothetical protein [Stenotrophomonas maltophilia]